MGWLDKFKALFNIELNSPLVYITKNSDNKVDSGKEIYQDKEKNRVEVFLDKLSEEKKEELVKILQENINEGNKFLENETYSLLNDLYSFQRRKGDDKRILDFFEKIIPDKDLEALENSLYLRTKFKEREDVRNLKQDIRNRFGDRGNNISNLCTAGYFENFLMPLYNSSKGDFEKIYELAVSKSALAIFVHNQMDDEKIIEDIKAKLQISKKYGLKFLHIHGIGDQNIKTIKKCINDNKELFNFYDKEIFQRESIIVVEILL